MASHPFLHTRNGLHLFNLPLTVQKFLPPKVPKHAAACRTTLPELGGGYRCLLGSHGAAGLLALRREVCLPFSSSLVSRPCPCPQGSAFVVLAAAYWAIDVKQLTEGMPFRAVGGTPFSTWAGSSTGGGRQMWVNVIPLSPKLTNPERVLFHENSQGADPE